MTDHATFTQQVRAMRADWDRVPAQRTGDCDRPTWGTEDYRRYAALFNDISYAPTSERVLFSDRHALADYLWQQGWRRDVRPEDVTEHRASVGGE